MSIDFCCSLTEALEVLEAKEKDDLPYRFCLGHLGELDDQDVLSLSLKLSDCYHLTHLYLTKSPLTDISVSRILSGVVRAASLQHLDLSLNEIKDSSCATIGAFLDEAPKLELLNLNDNDIGDEGVKLLLPSISRHLYLKILMLERNPFSQKVVQPMLDALQNNNVLMRLDASHLNSNRLRKKLLEGRHLRVQVFDKVLASNNLAITDLNHFRVNFLGSTGSGKSSLVETLISGTGLKALEKEELKKLHAEVGGPNIKIRRAKCYASEFVYWREMYEQIQQHEETLPMDYLTEVALKEVAALMQRRTVKKNGVVSERPEVEQSLGIRSVQSMRNLNVLKKRKTNTMRNRSLRGVSKADDGSGFKLKVSKSDGSTSGDKSKPSDSKRVIKVGLEHKKRLMGRKVDNSDSSLGKENKRSSKEKSDSRLNFSKSLGPMSFRKSKGKKNISQTRSAPPPPRTFASKNPVNRNAMRVRGTMIGGEMQSVGDLFDPRKQLFKKKFNMMKNSNLEQIVESETATETVTSQGTRSSERRSYKIGNLSLDYGESDEVKDLKAHVQGIETLIADFIPPLPNNPYTELHKDFLNETELPSDRIRPEKKKSGKRGTLISTGSWTTHISDHSSNKGKNAHLDENLIGLSGGNLLTRQPSFESGILRKKSRTIGSMSPGMIGSSKSVLARDRRRGTNISLASAMLAARGSNNNVIDARAKRNRRDNLRELKAPMELKRVYCDEYLAELQRFPKSLTLHLWEFSGGSLYANIHSTFLTKSRFGVNVLCFDMTSLVDPDKTRLVRATRKLNYILTTHVKNSNTLPLLLVGTKLDLLGGTDELERVNEILKKCTKDLKIKKMIQNTKVGLLFFPCDLVDGFGVSDVRKQLYKACVQSESKVEKTDRLSTRDVALLDLLTCEKVEDDRLVGIVDKEEVEYWGKRLNLTPERIERNLMLFADMGHIVYLPHLDSFKDIVIGDVQWFVSSVSASLSPQTLMSAGDFLIQDSEALSSLGRQKGDFDGKNNKELKNYGIVGKVVFEYLWRGKTEDEEEKLQLLSFLQETYSIVLWTMDRNLLQQKEDFFIVPSLVKAVQPEITEDQRNEVVKVSEGKCFRAKYEFYTLVEFPHCFFPALIGKLVQELNASEFASDVKISIYGGFYKFVLGKKFVFYLKSDSTGIALVVPEDKLKGVFTIYMWLTRSMKELHSQFNFGLRFQIMVYFDGETKPMSKLVKGKDINSYLTAFEELLQEKLYRSKGVKGITTILKRSVRGTRVSKNSKKSVRRTKYSGF